MRKVEKLAAVIVLILLAFVYGHVHKTHAIYDRMIENDQYVMMDVSQDQISQEFVCEEETLDGIQVKCQNLQEDPETEIRIYLQDCENGETVAESVKKVGDIKGADADEFKVLKAQLDKQNGVSQNNQTADNSESGNRTRKKSDKNMNNYRKIVVADNEEGEEKYKSEYRGRVQDKNVTIEPKPMFVLTYNEKHNDVKRQVNYHKYIEELNSNKVLPERLLITNEEAPLTEEQVKKHFASIDEQSAAIVASPNDVTKRFARSLDFYLVQDFDNAIEDLNQAVMCESKFFPAYFNRALIRFKQLEYQKVAKEYNDKNAEEQKTKTGDYEMVKRDLDKVIELAPDFVYAYYNRGNVLSSLKAYRAAIVDYDKAIELDSKFAEAYYNRGLTHIYLGNNRQGIQDLSKAGELDLFSAYNINKRITERKE